MSGSIDWVKPWPAAAVAMDRVFLSYVDRHPARATGKFRKTRYMAALS